MRIGRLLFPALRWDASRGFAPEAESIERALERGVGGFILFGGEAAAVRALTGELARKSPEPLLIAADLERGAGQQFEGATPLPPLAALGALDDLEVTRQAGELTAREARALGVNWVYAPVADVDLEPLNPIVGTRAFGTDPARVAAHVAAWVEGCRRGGVLACAKHFPGHGRTVADSHAELPFVHSQREALDADLAPFRAAIQAGVDSIMTAHVGYPALDATRSPATLSRPIIHDLLRVALRFQGLVVTDALIMAGVLEKGAGEGKAAVAALAAGCDALLYPANLAEVMAEIDGSLNYRVAEGRVVEAIARVEAAALRAAGGGGGEWGRAEDRAWALDVAIRSLRTVRGAPALPAGPVDLLTVDDDLGGPYPPPARDTFAAALRDASVDLREVRSASDERPAIVAVYSDIRAWKGRPGISPTALEAVVEAMRARPDAAVVLFGHPRLAEAMAGPAVLGAWGGEALMQEAAAHWLLAHRSAI